MNESYRLIYTQEQILKRVAEMGAQIKRDIPAGEPIHAVCVLKGAVIFFSDLVKAIDDRDVFFGFVSASSYGDQTISSGSVKMNYSSMDEDVKGLNILIVEDIIDTGRTLNALKLYFKEQGAATVKMACLLDKPMCRVVKGLEADYVGFTLDTNRYVVGYGLDNAQKYRNYNGIYEKVD